MSSQIIYIREARKDPKHGIGCHPVGCILLQKMDDDTIMLSTSVCSKLERFDKDKAVGKAFRNASERHLVIKKPYSTPLEFDEINKVSGRGLFKYDFMRDKLRADIHRQVRIMFDLV
jgi:hypothetical protein